MSAPRDATPQSEAVAEWANVSERPPSGPEPLVSSVLRFAAIPTQLYRVTAPGPLERRARSGSLPRYFMNDRTYMSLAPPSGADGVDVSVIPFDAEVADGPPDTRDVATRLLALHLQDLCARRGLCEVDQARNRSRCYFPSGIGEDGWIGYRMRSGRPSRIRVAGERTFSQRDGTRMSVHYHLAVELRPILRLSDEPIVLAGLGLHLTSPDGRPLSPKVAFRRQRKMRKTWWNNAVLARLLAATQWLSGGEDHVDLAEPTGLLVLDSRLMSLTSPIGVAEPTPVEVDSDSPAEMDDTAVIEDEDASGGDVGDDHADA